MARSRMIRPEFWDDEKLAKLSLEARLTFIGLWTHSDDYGVVKGNHEWLKSKIYPYDKIKPENFSAWIDQLRVAGRITRFTANGETFYFINNFLKHQKIEKPSHWRNPPLPDYSPTTPRLLPDYSPTTPRPVGTETETETETEVNNETAVSISAVAESTVLGSHSKLENARRFVDLYTKYLVTPGYARAVKALTKTRITHISARLKDHPDWDKWEKFFRDYIPQSKFLIGLAPPQSGRKPFKLDIDWLTNETNFTKIREGKYHGN